MLLVTGLNFNDGLFLLSKHCYGCYSFVIICNNKKNIFTKLSCGLIIIHKDFVFANHEYKHNNIILVVSL